MATWDRQEPARLAKQRDAAVRTQVRDVVGAFSPYWRSRFSALGTSPQSVSDVAALSRLAAVGERDVCPDGDPAGMAAMVLQASESGYAAHAPGPALRRALIRRVVSSDSYRRVVETETRPTTYTWDGLAMRYPVASTRADLDVVARAGARLWQVLGLTAADSVVAALPAELTSRLLALRYAALASGSPALFAGVEPDAVAEVLRLAPATVLAAPADAAADLVDELAAGQTPMDTIRTLLLVGAPSPGERRAATEALRAAGAADDAVVLAVHTPAGARVLWGECRQAAAAGAPPTLHTYPDLDVVQVVDPETGDPDPVGGPVEPVLTQLGFGGTALLRWRTGDLADGPPADGPCPSCGRVVPRLAGVRRGALVRALPDRPPVDLRAMAGALSGRPEIQEWRIVLGRRVRDNRRQLLVYFSADGEPGDVIVSAAGDIRVASGQLPDQFVGCEPGRLPEAGPEALTPRITIRG